MKVEIKQKLFKWRKIILEVGYMSKTVVSLVGMDIADYVRKNETKTVRKNVSIPSYLNELGKKKNLNFSQILQEALLAELNRS